MLSRALLVAAALFLTAQAAHAQTVKVASVDSQRVLLDTKAGKAAKARLTAWLDKEQKAIDQTQEALRQEKAAVDKITDPSERQRKTEQLQTKVSQLAQRWETARSEAATRERKEMEPILAKMDKVVQSVATREDYTLVVEKDGSGLLYTAPSLTVVDITGKVVQAYDAAP